MDFILLLTLWIIMESNSSRFWIILFGSLWIRFSGNYLFLHGHFWTQSNWSAPSAANPFPKFNSCLHCIRNALTQQKLMRSFKYLWFVVLLSWQIFPRHSWVSKLSRSYLSYSFDLPVLLFIKLTPPVPFTTRLSSTVPPSPCLPLR